MRDATRGTGFTLIELIMFIVIAAIFIPMAYIAFMAATRNSTKPEAIMRARFLAETKMEDLTGMTYTSITTPQVSYIDVTLDPRFGSPPMPSPNPYAGFQWRWSYSSVAYIDSFSHSSTSIVDLGATPSWTAASSYRLGDYVRSPDTNNILFYRVFSLSYRTWQPNTVYRYGEFVVPTTSNSHSYICVRGGTSGNTEPSWPITTGNPVNDGAARWDENTLFKVWQPDTVYYVDDLVVPRVASNGQTYRCTCTDAGATFCRSGSTDPDWTTADNEISWVQYTMVNGTSPPLFSGAQGSAYGVPCLTALRGSITWRESTVYKRITVYVKHAQIDRDYEAHTIVTARPGVYR